MINRDGQNGSAAETAFASMLALGADGGLTVAIKDCLDVAGHTTRCGSAAYADAAPPGPIPPLSIGCSTRDVALSAKRACMKSPMA